MWTKQTARRRGLRPIISQQIPTATSPIADSPTHMAKSKGKRKLEVPSPKIPGSKQKKVKTQEHSSRPHTRSSPSKDKSESMPTGYDATLAFSHRFFTEKNKSNWEIMSNRPILVERTLNFNSFKGTGILELLEDQHLLFTITNPEPYVSGIVYDFYSNLSPEITNPTSPQYPKVYVRGHIFEFSPKKINEYFISSVRYLQIGKELDIESNLDLVASELTGSSTTWPKKSNLLTTHLTTKYSLLFRIVVYNWIPKVHVTTISPQIASVLYRLGKGVKMDLENLIFSKIVAEIDSTVSRPILGYPSLIYNILMSQHNIEDGDSLTPLGKPLTISDKLLHGKHVDIEGEKVSGHASQFSASTSAAMADVNPSTGMQEAV